MLSFSAFVDIHLTRNASIRWKVGNGSVRIGTGCLTLGSQASSAYPDMCGI